MIRRAVLAIDDLWCRTLLNLRGDSPVLLSFLLHSVRAENDAGEMDRLVDPAQTIAVSSLDRLVATFLETGYTFIAPDQLGVLEPEGRYVLLTFDDGYFNNVHALPVLRQHGVPATFFISTRHVLEHRAFWWDVLFRERTRAGAGTGALDAERAALKRLRHDEIDDYLTREFGRRALQPAGDHDRAFTPAELRAFAAQPLVHIGNHTAHHAILTNYDAAAAEAEICTAQLDLEEMLGTRPDIIAYPNGSYSADVLAATHRAGIGWGITLDPGRNPLIASADRRLCMARYCFTSGHDTTANLTSYRAGVSLRRWVERRAHTRAGG